MEDEDSYSYLGAPAPLVSPLARAAFQSSCLQKRSIQELYNQLAILHYIKSQPGFQPKPPIPKRVKPPVPKFEDSYKKIKTENVEQSTANRLSSVDIVNQSRGFEPICRNHRSEAANKVNESQVVPETYYCPDLVLNTLFKDSEPEAAKLDQFSLFSVKIEEGDEVKTEAPSSEGHSSLGSPESPELTATTSSQSSLDRKDMKKFQKFVELCDDYQKKLNISNQEVSEKFKRLAILVIPKLLSHFKSKPFESVAAAILLYACREVNFPITLKQIVSVADSKEKLINKCVFTLKEILPQDTEVKHFKAGEFIKVMAEKLKLTEHVRAGAVKIWENIERLNFMKSIHAMTLAACCLKFACSLSDSDKEFETLAVAAGITKMTLKNMYRELFPYRFYFITADCMLGDPKDLKIL